MEHLALQATFKTGQALTERIGGTQWTSIDLRSEHKKP